MCFKETQKASHSNQGVKRWVNLFISKILYISKEKDIIISPPYPLPFSAQWQDVGVILIIRSCISRLWLQQSDPTSYFFLNHAYLDSSRSSNRRGSVLQFSTTFSHCLCCDRLRFKAQLNWCERQGVGVEGGMRGKGCLLFLSQTLPLPSSFFYFLVTMENNCFWICNFKMLHCDVL